MAYVPIVPSSPVQPPSPRTRELTALLTQVLQEYQKAHPSVTAQEIRAALRLTGQTAGTGKNATATLLALGLGIGFAALAVGLIFLRGGSGDLTGSEGMPMIVMAVILFVAILLAVVKVSSR